MKLTVFTSIFGHYDDLNEPLYNNKNIDFVCFTDQDFKSDTWKIVKKKPKLTPRRQSRIYKILSHKYIKTPISLCMDGRCILKKNPFPYIKKFLSDYDWVVSKHRTIDCVYKEAIKCVEVGKASESIVMKQISKFKKNGFPKHTNSVDNKVILRRMTPTIREFEKAWWEEYINGSQRDQMAFGYTAWRMKLEFGIFNWKRIAKGRRHLK